MAPNRLFLPTATLESWLARGAVETTAGLLTVSSSGDRFSLQEAVRVLSEVSSREDRRGLVGRVRTAKELEGCGARAVQNSLLLGEAAYEVEIGFLASPVGVAGTRRESEGVVRLLSCLEDAVTNPSDEEILAEYLMVKLE